MVSRGGNWIFMGVLLCMIDGTCTVGNRHSMLDTEVTMEATKKVYSLSPFDVNKDELQVQH